MDNSSVDDIRSKKMINLTNNKIRKVYEMVCSHGIDEEEKMLYTSNTQEIRAQFINNMKELMIRELEFVKGLPCEGDVKTHLEKIYNETLGYLDTMSETFVHEGEAFINAFIFLKIEERFLIEN